MEDDQNDVTIYLKYLQSQQLQISIRFGLNFKITLIRNKNYLLYANAKCLPRERNPKKMPYCNYYCPFIKIK